MRQIAYGGGQMERREYVIYSSHLKKDMHIIQYGHSGLPIIGFPTQCAPCTNYEDFGATRVLEPYFEEGQMQLFCVETVDGESWCCKDGINTWRSAVLYARNASFCNWRRFGRDTGRDHLLQKTGAVLRKRSMGGRVLQDSQIP